MKAKLKTHGNKGKIKFSYSQIKRGRPRKFTLKQHTRIKAMRKSNIPVSVIAAKMKCTDVTIRKYLSIPIR